MNQQNKTSEERRQMYLGFFKAAIRNMTPNCAGGQYSNQQVAAAKGQATKQMLDAGF